ncbi:MAG: FlaA1/EpsC-like NDP-sugar epimerase [Sediminicola sp.]|jgi:FlaA1/EpsC-like NDP-sugar epimerase|tara:strand:- start:4834 stop:6741 length:1908 start_codon:yes stop_codon:yes gene_type:complete
MVKKYLKEILVKKNTPRWLVLFIDLYIVLNTFVFSYFVRFNFTLDFDTSVFKYQMPFVLVTFLAVFLLIGSYKGIIRHTGIRDAFNAVIVSFLAFLICVVLVFLNRILNLSEELTVPISIITIHLLLNVITLIGSRFLFKAFYDVLFTDIKIHRRVLIYGAGEAGILTYSVLRNDKENESVVVGFIDDAPRKTGKKINGLLVFGGNQIDRNFIETKNIDEIILSMQKARPGRLLEIGDYLSTLPVEVKVVPPAKNWINGNLEANQIKKLNILDLLGRSPIELNSSILKKEFNEKVVLVTGAAGSIGSEISRQIARFNYSHLILVDQAESYLYDLEQGFREKGYEQITAIVADVRNVKRMNQILERFKPNFIFHAAAYKHVPLMEKNPYEAVSVNVSGTVNMAQLAIKNNVEKFVMVSTDKAVNPTNIMGATKRIAEMFINSLEETCETKFITTRFGNVLGSNGSVIPLFQRQINDGGPLTVTHKDINRFFMTIPEACQLVLEAGAMGTGGEIFVFDMGESIKIYDLAKNMINLSGLNYPSDIDIKITGLRPGEKIYEELLAAGENTRETYHDKIMIAKTKPIDKVKINQQIKDLCKINQGLNSILTVRQMKIIVPEYVSKNSEFEALDSINVLVK